jgi:hypothetical protein
LNDRGKLNHTMKTVKILDGKKETNIRFNERTTVAVFPKKIQGTLKAGIAKDAIRAYCREKIKPFSMSFITNSGIFVAVFY